MGQMRINISNEMIHYLKTAVMLFCCRGREPVDVIMDQKEGLGRREEGGSVNMCKGEKKSPYPNFGLDRGSTIV